MTDVLSVSLTGDRELILKMTTAPGRVRMALVRAVTSLSILVRRAVQEKLDGPVLQHRSGRLWQSIQREVIDQPTEVVGRVFSSGDVKYAAVHEFGGQRSYEIVPKKAQALSWQGPGGRVFFKRVIHPPLKERSFMRSTLQEFADEIKSKMTEAVVAELKT